MEETKKILIERVFDASRERVWKAWTDSEEVKKWWGPAGFTAPSAKVDFRVGGVYLYAMHGPAGSQWDVDMYSGGEYKEIVPNEKIVATDYFADENGNKVLPSDQGLSVDFPAEQNVTVLFEDAPEGRTKLSIIYDVPDGDAARKAMLDSGMEEGWSTSLDKLAESLKN